MKAEDILKEAHIKVESKKGIDMGSYHDMYDNFSKEVALEAINIALGQSEKERKREFEKFKEAISKQGDIPAEFDAICNERFWELIQDHYTEKESDDMISTDDF